MKWHPFAELFPQPEGADWDAFKASIKATKGNKDNPILYRMVDGQAEGLDGRTRYLACKELKIKPTLKKVKVKDDDVKAFIVRCNVTRRHMSAELRQSVVAELKTEGHSNRAIADTVGTSEATVRRDLEAQTECHSGAPNGAPDSQGKAENEETPQKVVGRDGKIYPVIRPGEPFVGCRPCRVSGKPKPDCKACEAVRAAKTTAHPESGSAEEAAEENMVRINGKLESFCRGIMAFVEEHLPEDFWLDHQNLREGAIRKFRDGCEMIRTRKCSSTCDCGGNPKCRSCHGTRRYPKFVQDQR